MVKKQYYSPKCKSIYLYQYPKKYLKVIINKFQGKSVSKTAKTLDIPREKVLFLQKELMEHIIENINGM